MYQVYIAMIVEGQVDLQEIGGTDLCVDQLHCVACRLSYNSKWTVLSFASCGVFAQGRSLVVVYLLMLSQLKWCQSCSQSMDVDCMC